MKMENDNKKKNDQMDNVEHGKALAELKLKIKAHDKLHPCVEILDDKFLLGFLRGVKYDVEKAFEYIECFIKMRTDKYKDITRTYRPSNMAWFDQSQVQGEGLIYLLKNRDPLGRVVAVFKLNAWKPSKTSFEDMMATAIFYLDESLRTYFSVTTENDIVVIVDCSGFSFQQAFQVTPRRFMMTMDMFMKSIPSRPKAAHLVNEGVIMRGILRWASPLIPKKLRERLQLHSNRLESLHALVPPSILPTWLGGDLSEEDAFEDGVSTRIRGNEEFYQKLEELTY